MTDKTSNDPEKEDDIQALSQRFLKLWQEQLSLTLRNDAPMVPIEDWAIYWNEMIQNGMVQDGMPDMSQNFKQQFPTDLWKSMMPRFSPNDNNGHDHDRQKKTGKEHADRGHQTRTNETWTNETGRPAPPSPSSVDIIDLLRQLASHVERLDLRLTELEQETVSSKVTKSGRKTSRRPAKKSQAKSAKSK